MADAVTSFITISIIITVSFVLGRDMLTTFDTVTDAWSAEQTRLARKASVRISGPVIQSTPATSTVKILVINKGDVALGRFAAWDLIFETQQNPGLGVSYLKYSSTTPPATNRWALHGIFLDAASSTAETVGPGVFNPGEEMVVVANPNPSVVSDSYGRVTFSTPEGVKMSVMLRVLP